MGAYVRQSGGLTSNARSQPAADADPRLRASAAQATAPKNNVVVQRDWLADKLGIAVGLNMAQAAATASEACHAAPEREAVVATHEARAARMAAAEAQAAAASAQQSESRVGQLLADSTQIFIQEPSVANACRGQAVASLMSAADAKRGKPVAFVRSQLQQLYEQRPREQA